MNQEFSLISALRTLLKWKKPLLILTLSSGVIAAVFSFFIMDEYYLSWATFYPTNQALTDRTAIFNTESSNQLDYFGGKADVNRALTIANSTPIIEFAIDSFHLAAHYKIDTTERYWRTKVRKKFEKNYSAIKTDRDAVEISLYDTDPKLAAYIVNTIVRKIDEANQFYIIETKRKNRDAIIDQMVQDRKMAQAYIDTLADLGERYRIKVSSGADGTVIVDGNDYKAVQLYKSILAQQTNLNRELNNLTSIAAQMDVSLRNHDTSLYVLESAFPADRKSKPIRTLVILTTMLITGFVSIIGVLFIEQIGELKKQL